MRRNHASFSPRLALRVLAAVILAVGVTGVVIIATLGPIARRGAPAVAARQASDARAMTQVAELLIRAGSDPGALDRAGLLAQEAVRRDALIPAAYAVLAQVAAARGDEAGAERRLRYAERLSRRQLDVQLRLAQMEALAGNERAALSHLDAALRVHPGSRPLILPMLIRLAADRRAIDPLTDLLVTEPNWRPNFLSIATGSSPHLETLGLLFERLDRRSSPVPPEIRARLIRRLADTGLLEAAARQIRNATGEQLEPTLSNGSFGGNNIYPPFDWQLDSDGGSRAAVARAPGSGDFALHVTVGTEAPEYLARQIVRLAPGSYELRGRVLFDGPGWRAPPRWTIECAGSGQQLAAVTPSYSGDGWREFSTSFLIGSGCPFAWISLIPDGPGGANLSVYFDELRLEPSRS